jgi:hypothetical protein
MPSDYPFVICWPLYHLSFNLRLQITPLLYVGHCIICPSSINAFWLPLCSEDIHWSRTDNTMAYIYQCGNQRTYIEVGQTIQWPTDTKGVIRIRISKNRQHNGQMKKYKRTNNDLQNIHIKHTLRVDMSLPSNIFSWFRANQFLFFPLNVASLAEKQHILILKSLDQIDDLPHSC